MEVDAAGNLYIADFDNHRVRRVDAATGTHHHRRRHRRGRRQRRRRPGHAGAPEPAVGREARRDGRALGDRLRQPPHPSLHHRRATSRPWPAAGSAATPATAAPRPPPASSSRCGCSCWRSRSGAGRRPRQLRRARARHASPPTARRWPTTAAAPAPRPASPAAASVSATASASSSSRAPLPGALPPPRVTCIDGDPRAATPTTSSGQCTFRAVALPEQRGPAPPVHAGRAPRR